MRFTLPANASALCLVRRFIREVARSTSLTEEQIEGLQLAVTRVLNVALAGNNNENDYVVLEIDTKPSGIQVDVKSHEKLFSLNEFLTRC
jgi:anti-sigma regulatory factor (Ser/Thr protein kinase)